MVPPALAPAAKHHQQQPATMVITNRSRHFNADLMAIVNTIKAYVEAGGKFPANMTRDEAAARVLDAVCNYGTTPTWFFTGPDKTGATDAKVMQAINVLRMSLVDEPLMPAETPTNISTIRKMARLIQEDIDTYLHGCRVGVEWKTCCAEFPRVPRLFRVDNNGKFTFDDQALREFVDSLPADAFLYPADAFLYQHELMLAELRAAPRTRLMTKSTDGASTDGVLTDKAPTGKSTRCVLAPILTDDATLFWTLRSKIGLSETDTRDLLAMAPLFKLSREDIKDIARYLVENLEIAVMDHLIVVMSCRLRLDHEVLMAGAVADGWTSDDMVEFLATAAEDGLPRVISRGPVVNNVEYVTKRRPPSF